MPSVRGGQQQAESAGVSPAGQIPDERLQLSISELEHLAAKAFEANRRKECLALLRVILNLDPQNKNACDMRSRIQSDLDRELHRIRSLLPRLPKDEKLYAMSDLILQRVLDIDPQNEEAEALLQQIESSFAAEHSEANQALDGSSAAAIRTQSLQPDLPKQKFDLKMGAAIVGFVLLLVAALAYVGSAGWLERGRTDQHLTSGYSSPPQPNTANTVTSLSGTLEITVDDGVEIFLDGRYAGSAPIAPLKLTPAVYDLRYEFAQMVLGQEKVRVTADEASHNSMHAFLGDLEFFVLPRSESRVQINDKPAVPLPAHLTVTPGDYRLLFTAEGYEPQTVLVSIAAGQTRNVTAILKPALPPAARETSSSLAVASPQLPLSGRNTDITIAKGTLVVSSPVPLDIYRDATYLGSAPVSLELPVGAQTLENRYGNLHRQVTHVIKSNETTRAMVTFDVDVQINAKPWAEVFLDGPERKDLGQTPLSGVRVPIGSVLVFENPGFPAKMYRVTGNEKGIQIVFP
jgi:hypothetical protein